MVDQSQDHLFMVKWLKEEKHLRKYMIFWQSGLSLGELKIVI